VKLFLDITLKLSKIMDVVAGAALCLMISLTTLDVILRYLGRPIPGTYELVALAGAFVIGFAIPKTSWDKTHVTVDILVAKIGSRRIALEVVTRVFSLFLFFLFGFNLITLGASLARTGEGTLTLVLPLYPVAYALGICCFAECVVLLADIVKVTCTGGHRE
jgi:TRAP-type C4-dicarboxylate transport system permease small subunit